MSRAAKRWQRTITRATVSGVVALLERPAPAPVAQEPVRWSAPRKPAKAKAALPPPATTATRRDAIIRATADRTARELERPVDSLPGMKPEHVLRAEAARAVPMIGAVQAKREFIVPANPLEARRQRLQRAIDWLNQHAWFVQIVNREAPVRTYRVAGKRDPMLAEDVIRVALEKGMVE